MCVCVCMCLQCVPHFPLLHFYVYLWHVPHCHRVSVYICGMFRVLCHCVSVRLHGMFHILCYCVFVCISLSVVRSSFSAQGVISCHCVPACICGFFPVIRSGCVTFCHVCVCICGAFLFCHCVPVCMFGVCSPFSSQVESSFLSLSLCVCLCLCLSVSLSFSLSFPPSLSSHWTITFLHPCLVLTAVLHASAVLSSARRV